MTIVPAPDNPRFWSLDGQTTMLLGGSVEDNLFQIESLEEELDRIVDAGGNYVRNTLSCRDEGNVWMHERDPSSGPYDLNSWNPVFWERLDLFLRLTKERGVVAQFELFDRFDYAREPWNLNPFNPANNANYTRQEVGLPVRIDSHPGQRENPFFRSVPQLENNEMLLGYQRAYMENVLSATLPYRHVLYCISNETNESPHWGAYWADFVRERSRAEGVTVQVTEMWDDHNLGSPMHRHTVDDPARYSFVDASQNNHQTGFTHFERFRDHVRRVNAVQPRPINCVKVYGGGGRHGTVRQGMERWLRTLFAGAAAVRFHRPDSGLGSSSLALNTVAAARALCGEFDFTRAEPLVNLEVAPDRDAAYATLVRNEGIAVVFLRDGSMAVPSEVEIPEDATVVWRRCSERETLEAPFENPLRPPTDDYWLGFIRLRSA